MKYTGCDVLLCSLDGKAIRSMEGYSVNVNIALEELNLSEVRSFIVPGGNTTEINNQKVKEILQELRKKNTLIAGICAGVDRLEDAGILKKQLISGKITKKLNKFKLLRWNKFIRDSFGIKDS